MRAGQDQRENPADQRKGDRREDEQGVFEGIEGHVQQEKDQHQAHRHDHRQASLLVPQLIELAGQFIPHAGRKRDFVINFGQHFADGARQIAPSHAEFNRNIALVILPIDHKRAGLIQNRRQLLERNPRAVGCRHLDVTNRLHVLAVLGEKAHYEIEPALSFQYLRDRLSTDCSLYHCIYVRDQNAIARARGPIHLD